MIIRRDFFDDPDERDESDEDEPPGDERDGDERDADESDESDESDDDLDEDFPLGDGTADTTAVVHCPYCGEPNDIALDPGSGEAQDYVEDCQVCCRPWRVRVTYDAEGAGWVDVRPADE